MSTDVAKEDTIWADGCYDICHFGHANSLRQAKLLGKKLIVGVHSDAEITKHKGPPVFTEQERYEMVRSIKWVDQVVEDAPYVSTLETLDKYNCQYCSHGDDLTMDAQGNDTYHLVKTAGRYKEFKRTQGVSTTDIVGRMLLASRINRSDSSESLQDAFAKDSNKASPWTGVSKFLQTSQKIAQFMAGSKEATENDVVVYVAGAFDMFHNGHLAFLKECSKLGTYLVVGLHTDEEIERYRGPPIMTLNERTLSALACKYVNEVVIGAPYKVSEDMIKHFNAKHVCNGMTEPAKCADGSDPYEIPKKLNVYNIVDSKSNMTASVIVERIVANRARFAERNRKKQEKEMKAYENWERTRKEGGVVMAENTQ